MLPTSSRLRLDRHCEARNASRGARRVICADLHPAIFREHVERTLELGIPTPAKEIVHSIASMDDDESSDPF